MPAPPRAYGARAAAKPDIAPAHELIYLIDAFASRYGWTRSETLRMPVAVAHQLLALRLARPADPGEPSFNAAADRANGERLRRLKAERLDQQAAWRQAGQNKGGLN